MSFMRGPMPLRRTLFYLEQGKVILRENVSVIIMGYHRKPLPEQKGASDFMFWHWSQLQYKNPHVQLVKQPDYCITPFAMAFLSDGREVLFDLENKTKDDIVNVLQKTLGKTALVMKRENLERQQSQNAAAFGGDCKRHCMCEVQGQQACTSLLNAPKHMKAEWRWNHNLPK